MQACDVERGNKPLPGPILQVTKVRPCHRHLGLRVLGFGRGARERPRRVLIALHHVGLSARLGRTREVAAPSVDVGDAKQRPGILLLFGRDGLVHPQGLVQASSLQQEIPEHYPRLEVAGIDDERALDQRRGFVGTPDGHEEQGDRVPHIGTEDGGIVHHGAIFALGGRPVVLRDESLLRHRQRTPTLFLSIAKAFARASSAWPPASRDDWSPPPTIRP